MRDWLLENKASQMYCIFYVALHGAISKFDFTDVTRCSTTIFLLINYTLLRVFIWVLSLYFGQNDQYKFNINDMLFPMLKRLHNLFKVQISTNSKKIFQMVKHAYAFTLSLFIQFRWNRYQTAAYFIFVSLYVSTFQSKRTTAFVHVKYSCIVNNIFFNMYSINHATYVCYQFYVNQ